MADQTFGGVLDGGALGSASASVTLDPDTGIVSAATLSVALPFARYDTLAAIEVLYFKANGDQDGGTNVIIQGPGYAPGDDAPWTETLTLGTPVTLDPGKAQYGLRIRLSGKTSTLVDLNLRSDTMAPAYSGWAPGAWPAGTTVAETTFTPTDEPCVVGVEVVTFEGVYNGITGLDLLPIYRLVSGAPVLGRDIVMDVQTWLGVWVSQWASDRRLPGTAYETSYSFLQTDIATATRASQLARAEALGVGTPSGIGPGLLFYGDGPGLAYTPQVPRRVGFRFSSDPVGTYFSTTDLIDVFPASGDALLSTDLDLRFELDIDAVPAGIETTGDNPGVDGGDGPPVGANPGPGGITVTTPDGPVLVPVPGGTPNGPITIRIDDGTMYVIYDGMVIYVYELDPEDYSRLTGSTAYVGIFDPDTGTVTPDGTPVLPPLGGWRYVLHARERQPLGLAPRLFYAWASRWQGLTVAVSLDGTAQIVEDYPQEWESDPTLTVYRGGHEWLIDSAAATAVARAGGLAYLTEVPAPTP